MLVEWTNETDVFDLSDYEGFIYRIDYTDGTFYLGKKNFKRHLTLPPLKGKKRKRKVVKESNWRDYVGSNDWGKFKVVQKRTIIDLAKGKGELTFKEVEHLVKNNVLRRPDCINNNISGKFYPRNIGYGGITWKKDLESSILENQE